MRNILLVSFALLFFSCDDDNNPVTGCCGDVCAVTECACGCEGTSGCDCATNCQCETCAGGGCSAEGCAADCACGCNGESGENGCTCATDCQCSTDEADECEVSYCIDISNFAFDPSTLSITIGDVVRWTNNGSNHTVTGDDDLWGSETLSNGDTFEHTFNSAGNFSYHCNFHGSMTGTVTVTE